MPEHLAGLFPGQSIVHRPVQVVGDLRDLPSRDESAHCDQAAVTRCKRRSQPEIAEEHVGRVLDEARRDLPELVSDPRRPLLLCGLVERKLRSRGGRKLIGSDIAALEHVPRRRDRSIAFAQPV
jgi:hypothetical protein